LRKRREKYDKPPKDSGNKSTLPSKEPIKPEVDRRTKSLRKKSDKTVCGQLGHEGTMHMKVELPDEIENVSSRFCRECGRYLAYVQGEPDYVTQKIDLPPITPIYYERRFNKNVCAYGCCNRDYAPRKRDGNAITFGKNIRAFLEKPAIPSDNNASERGIRKLKVKQKNIRLLPVRYWCRCLSCTALHC